MKIPFLVDTEDSRYVVYETSMDTALSLALDALGFESPDEEYIDVSEFSTFEHGDVRDYEVLW
jgi:hypothetical protein